MQHRSRSGFTMVELLVVIAIIALLVSIILPGLGNAKKLAKLTKEEAAAKQLVTAFLTYAHDQKDRVVPSGPAWDAVHPGTTPAQFVLRPTDPFPNAPVYMEGSVSKTWVWHLYTATAYALHGLMIDQSTYDIFRNRSTANTGVVNGWAQYADTSAQAAFGYHPSFGVNGVYVGGSYSHGAFSDTGSPRWSQSNNRNGLKNFYLTHIGKALNPAKLFVYVGSRGGDVSGTGWWGYGATVPNSGIIRPGYWLVTPPRAYPNQRGGSGVGGQAWSANNSFDSRMVPGTWGNIDARHFRKAVTASLDGHIETLGLQDMRDMRRWSNFADRADWNFTAAR
ncbi:MAG: type II secretion system protein [Phycisphaerae bacterium]|nr:type II secretion system protein [Phycisphaerae bacterium]